MKEAPYEVTINFEQGFDADNAEGFASAIADVEKIARTPLVGHNPRFVKVYPKDKEHGELIQRKLALCIGVSTSMKQLFV